MEGYSEVAVTQKMNASVQMKRFIGTVIPLMLAILTIMLDLPSIFLVVKFLVCVALGYLSYRMFMGFYIEWEYTFVVNEIKFAKVMNKSRRKDLFTCQIHDTVLLTKSTDAEHVKKIPSDAKKYRFLSNTTDEYYIWVVKNDKEKPLCIYFEPNEVMLQSFKTLAKGKAFI